jgi:hypothetical protein
MGNAVGTNSTIRELAPLMLRSCPNKTILTASKGVKLKALK